MAIDGLLAAGYRIVSRSLFYEAERNYFQFDVRKNVAGIVLEKGPVRVEFKYEPVYPNQSTVLQRSALVATTIGREPLTPDLSMEVYENGEPRHVLIFDAKYRRDRGRDGYFYPKQDDIEKMYRYFHNICYKRYQPGRGRNPYDTQKVVSSAYILYPGNRLHSESQDTIGALPLRPNMAGQHRDAIGEKLKDLLYYAYLID